MEDNGRPVDFFRLLRSVQNEFPDMENRSKIKINVDLSPKEIEMNFDVVIKRKEYREIDTGEKDFYFFFEIRDFLHKLSEEQIEIRKKFDLDLECEIGPYDLDNITL